MLASSAVWFPVLVIAAAAVRVDSGSPIVFRQQRMGYRGQPFTLFKLRTMRAADQAPEAALFPGWTYPSDPRITPVGRWLRRYRIDELPQLYNVLKGDMSLVGPRPEPWDVATALGERIDGYHRRHEVLPGLTGLCQIDDLYLDFGTIEKSFAKARLDWQYVERCSLRLDLEILVRTVSVVLRGRGIH